MMGGVYPSIFPLLSYSCVLICFQFLPLCLSPPLILLSATVLNFRSLLPPPSLHPSGFTSHLFVCSAIPHSYFILLFFSLAHSLLHRESVMLCAAQRAPFVHPTPGSLSHTFANSHTQKHTNTPHIPIQTPHHPNLN